MSTHILGDVDRICDDIIILNKGRLVVSSSLNELKEKNIIANYETDERKESRAITDVKYIIYPSNEFISEQKAANKRNSDSDKHNIDPNRISVNKSW